ncbi:MAG: hypothetical protein LQ346_003687 [Caloplaca aetnensis]|nr:MAG: hypothetical protein LQ346_003687 [Caloplaca aetnensis]
MNSLLDASRQPQDVTSDQTTPEGPPTDVNQFPRNGWRAEDVKKCLGYTDDEYTQLYGKVEEAMRHADLIEVSLTGQRKTKLFAILEQVLPHDNAPTIPDFLRIKALHQLAIRINHNVKTRSGHAHHRKRPKGTPTNVSRPVIRSPDTRRPPSTPAATYPPPPPPPPPPPFLTPQFTQPTALSQPTPQAEPHTPASSVHHDLGNILLLGERDDNTQSICSVRQLSTNPQPGAPVVMDELTLGPWKSILVRDGVMRAPSDVITWKWGERRVKVPNDRVFRTVIEFMAAHGGFIDFDVESAHSGNPGARAKKKP